MHVGESFESIESVSVDEVRRLITSMPSKSSSVDFIPTSLLKLCPSVFSEIIARLVNLSFSEGIFPAKFKVAAVTPLLKKPSLDPDNPSSYRLISNLNNISKILERLFYLGSIHMSHRLQISTTFNLPTVLITLLKLLFFKLSMVFSTLLTVVNRLFLSHLILAQHFDTIDHFTLLSRLSTSFGVNGTTLAWLTSYLTNRSQTVRIGDISSTPSICLSGVPQGSVLGPVLFSLYFSPIGQLFRVLVFHTSNMPMMRNSTSASKVALSVLQLTA